MQTLQTESNISVLVVDDEPRLLASLEALLKYKDYQADTALGGKLACQKLEQNHYDVVLLDLNMDDLDGFAVMAYMADQGVNADIVVVSGETTFDAVRKALRLGASDYVKKPYSPEELFATIDSILLKKHSRVDSLVAIGTDGSEQQAAREKHQKSHNLFSKAEQIGKLGHWEWDEIAERYITCSEQYASLHDKTVEQMIETVTSDEEDRESVCEEDRERYKQVVDAAIERKQGWDIEYRRIDKAGNWIYLHEIGEPVLDDHGLIIKTVGTIQDITKIRRIEEELKQNHARFHQAEAMGQIGHFFWDRKVGQILYCSDQFARIYGMTVSEVHEHFISAEAEIDLIHPDDKVFYRQAINDSHEQSKAFEGEYRIITSSGDTRHVYERSELVLDNDGEPSQSFGTVQDITESKRLSDEKDRHNILAQEAPIGIIFNKSDGIAYFANKALTEITGFSNKQLTGALWDKQLHPEDRERVKKKWLENITSVESWVDEFRFQRPDGSIAWVEANTNPQLDSFGKIVAHVGTFMDITIRKQVEGKLHESEQRFSSLVHSQSDLICRSTADGILTFVNDSYISFMSNRKSELLGHSIYQNIPPKECESVKATLSQLSVEEPRQTHENSLVNTAGENRIFEWINHGLFDSNQTLTEIQSVGRDVTAIRESQNEVLQAHEKLERMAHYDVLTNLPNRVLLADRLSHAMVQCQRRNQTLAVAFLDLDGFKAVNDTFGHHMGDELLVALTRRMKEALREGDTLARIGGDEFIAVMVDLEKVENSEPILERLLKATADPITVGDVSMEVSASIGVTFYPQDGTDADHLIRHADQAMYVAKHAGKNRYHLFGIAQDI